MNRFLRHVALVLAIVTTSCGGGGGGGSSDSGPVADTLPETVNTAPSASSVIMLDANGGDANSGDELYVSYEYADADSDPESGTRLQWYRNDIAIVGANATAYTLSPEDDGTRIHVSVTPGSDGGNTTGETVHSAAMLIDYSVGTRLPVQTIRSAYTAFSYPIRIYLPRNFVTDRVYPIIYAPDAEHLFDKTADLLDELGKEVILVGIGYNDRQQRAADYLLPGTRDYYNFIALELVPFIEAQYRVDTDNRIYSGHSDSGLAGALIIFFEPPDNRLFRSYLLHDPNTFDALEDIQALNAAYSEQHSSLPINLLVSGSAYGNYKAANYFRWIVRDSEYTDIYHSFQFYEEEHAAMYLPSFRLGVDTLLPD